MIALRVYSLKFGALGRAQVRIEESEKLKSKVTEMCTELIVRMRKFRNEMQSLTHNTVIEGGFLS